MTISYNWLSEYLPVKLEPEKLSRILTSIGLEVESMEYFEEIKGGMKGLIIGEVLEVEKHPDADKLKLTKVNIGNGEPLQIVCGAPNVAAGQKVVVATIGTTIYPIKGEPLTMKKVKIRGVESNGMICAEDEIGLGNSHEGIMVLDKIAMPGTEAVDYFTPYTDWVYEIGLTPNRMDAMSHTGVARDVCAWLTHHERNEVKARLPFGNSYKADIPSLNFEVIIENTNACERYAGACITGVTIMPSPKWMQDRLKSIGIRPINNIVDITNYILHETGQPLHAFDADEIANKKIIVKNLPEKTSFITLDEKERKLSAEDIMICDGNSKPLCLGGVFGGLHSGVNDTTKTIFLESAWFNPATIRKTSFHHGLRTDAASRFEKGVDISNTVNVLKRAILLIKEIAGGEIAGDIIDVYPNPKPKKEITIKNHYLKKLSGKNYHADTVKKILQGLGFEIVKEGMDELRVNVPYSKPDTTLPADLVEEIMRIDGYDNVEIPTSITISPSVETMHYAVAYKEKVSNFLVGAGFYEIFTNSITNSAYYGEDVLQTTVKMINNLSAELNVMRPSMLETGLESITYNLNRKNNDIKFFEFGKTYSTQAPGKYDEKDHLCLYITGMKNEAHWKKENSKTDIFFLKGIADSVLQVMGITVKELITVNSHTELDNCLQAKLNGEILFEIGQVKNKTLQKFDIKQPVYYGDFNWAALLSASTRSKLAFTEIPKLPAVNRDLSIIVDKKMSYESVEKTVLQANVSKLKKTNLFDVFESEKLGANKKSLAISFTFRDDEKTLTDKEIDGMMNQIIAILEKELHAEIRKQ
ncbi:MAG TPA: phenylalanine--tRNA ligase subunit beta [Chitinophagaceae bacterium]|nr:phenylalanine--tRNA ligase subunit beta [Chitinophagaceae bacterium]